MPVQESLLTKVIGLFVPLGLFLPGAAGAAISLWSVRRIEGESLRQYWLRLLLAFASGSIIAHFVGRAILEHTGMTGISGDGILFVTGLYGWGLAENIRSQLPELVASGANWLKAKGGKP